MQTIRTLSHHKIKYKTGQTCNGLNKDQILLTEKTGSQIVGTIKFTGAGQLATRDKRRAWRSTSATPRLNLILTVWLYQLCPSSGNDLHSLRAGHTGAGPNLSEARSEPFGSARDCRTQISPRSAACRVDCVVRISVL